MARVVGRRCNRAAPQDAPAILGRCSNSPAASWPPLPEKSVRWPPRHDGREDALFGFGGSVLYELSRGAFKKYSVSNEQTVREPVVVGGSPAPPPPSASYPPSGPARKGTARQRAAAALKEGSDQEDGSASDVNTDDGVVPTSAIGVLAAAEAAKPAKKKKKETAAGVLRDYIKSKLHQDQTGGAAAEQAGASAGGADGDGVSDGAILQAVLDMTLSYTEKTRRT